MKKLLTAVLALALLLTLAAPAMAAGTPGETALEMMEAMVSDGSVKVPPENKKPLSFVNMFYLDLDQDGIPELLSFFQTADGQSIKMVMYYAEQSNGQITGIANQNSAFSTTYSSTGGTYTVGHLVRYNNGAYGRFSERYVKWEGSYVVDPTYSMYFTSPNSEYFRGELLSVSEQPYEEVDWRNVADRFALLNAAEKTHEIQLSTQNLSVNGQTIACDKYNIDGSNYFKLRDLAMLLNGTSNQFEVGYANNIVTIISGRAYTPNGSELLAGEDKSDSAVASRQTIIIDSETFTGLSVFNIGGNNYFKLRDLGDKLGFSVDFDSAANTAVVKSTDQFIGAHEATSSLRDGEYTVEYNDVCQKVQGGELLSVKLLELGRFTDEEVRAFLSAGVFPLSEYSKYFKDEPISLWEKDANVALIGGVGGSFSLEKKDDGFWYLIDLDGAYQYKTTEDASLFLPDCIRIKDYTSARAIYRDSFSAVIKAIGYAPHTPISVLIKDGCVIVCSISYHP